MRSPSVIISASLLISTAVYAVPIPKVHHARDEIATSTASSSSAPAVSKTESEVKQISSSQTDRYGKNGNLRTSKIVTSVAESDSEGLQVITDPSQVPTDSDPAGTSKSSGVITTSSSVTSTNKGGNKKVVTASNETDTSSESTTLTGDAAQAAQNEIESVNGDGATSLYTSVSVAGNYVTTIKYNKDGSIKSKTTRPIDAPVVDSQTGVDQATSSASISAKTGNGGKKSNTVTASAGSAAGQQTNDDGTVVGIVSGAEGSGSVDSTDYNPLGGGGGTLLSSGAKSTASNSKPADSGPGPQSASSSTSVTSANLQASHEGKVLDQVSGNGDSSSGIVAGQNGAAASAGESSISSGGITNIKTSWKTTSQTGTGTNGNIYGTGGSTIPNVSASSSSSSGADVDFGQGSAVSMATNGAGTSAVSTGFGLHEDSRTGFNDLTSVAATGGGSISPGGETTASQTGSISIGATGENISVSGARQSGPGEQSSSYTVAATAGGTTTGYGHNKAVLPGQAGSESSATTAKGDGSNVSTGGGLVGTIGNLGPYTLGSIQQNGASADYSGAATQIVGASDGGGRTYNYASSSDGKSVYAGSAAATTGNVAGGGATVGGLDYQVKGTGSGGTYSNAQDQATGDASLSNQIINSDDPKVSSGHTIIGTTTGGGSTKGVNSDGARVDSSKSPKGTTETIQYTNTVTTHGGATSYENTSGSTPHLQGASYDSSTGGARVSKSSKQHYP